MSNFILGMDGKTYHGPSGSKATEEITNIRDVTLQLEAGEADVTTRANSGWRATAATLREATLEFQMLWKPSDAAFSAIRDAFLNSDEIALLALDQTDGEGLDGDFTITSFSRGEPLEEGMTVDVTAKLSNFREWTTPA
ncbi:MAG: phage tail tube protein [Pseudomonadota bacterium]